MKSILITGASSGIGLATAEIFLSEGWTVGLLARRGDILRHRLAGLMPCATMLVCSASKQRQRWSGELGAIVKVDRMTKELIQNEETKEPFTRI